MRGRSPALWASVALGFGIFAIAFSPILVRLSELGPGATAVYRVVFALPALALWMGLEQRQTGGVARRLGRADWLVLLLAGLFWSGDLVCWHWAIAATTIVNANFLAMCAPFFVTVGAVLLYREPVGRSFLAGGALALVGGALLLGASLGFERAHLLGDAMGITTALFFAAYLLAIKRLRGRLPTGTVMFLSGLFSVPAMLAAAIGSGESLMATSLTGWGVLVALALVAQAAGQSLIALSMAHLPASFTSLALLCQPVMATLLAWALLGETATPQQAVGGAIVLVGIYIARRSSLPRRPIAADAAARLGRGPNATTLVSPARMPARRSGSRARS